MCITIDDIENALRYVSMDQKFMNHAYLCKETGQIFYNSEMYGSYELPEDIENPDKYIAIPHQNDLELGKSLVFEFAEKYLPEEIDRINSIFHSRGAYSRYKDLLDSKGYLDKWRKFEAERQRMVLEQWCIENSIKISG